MLGLVDVDVVMPRLASVLIDASYTKQPDIAMMQQYRTGVFGRAQVGGFGDNP
jgi:hypothetical protein